MLRDRIKSCQARRCLGLTRSSNIDELEKLAVLTDAETGRLGGYRPDGMPPNATLACSPTYQLA